MSGMRASGSWTGMLTVANLIELGQIECGLVVAGEGSREVTQATIRRLLQPGADFRLFAENLATLTLGSMAVAALLVNERHATDGHRLLGGAMRAATHHSRLCLGTSTEMKTDAATLLRAGVDLAEQTMADVQRELQLDRADVREFVLHQVGKANHDAIQERFRTARRPRAPAVRRPRQRRRCRGSVHPGHRRRPGSPRQRGYGIVDGNRQRAELHHVGGTMVSDDDGDDRTVASLSRRAAQRLLATAGDLVNLARTTGAKSRAMADLLLLDSQQAIFADLHRRFTQRAEQGDGGLPSALEALDLMWENIRALRGGAPALLHTLSSSDQSVQDRRAQFYVESTALLQEAIRDVFSADLGQLALPPARLAVLVRVALEGLVVELAQARTPSDVAVVDQAYADLRALFERYVVLGEEGPPLEEVSLEPIPLPW